uniref:Uncharacterized protein n=1 Tax=Setaria italica TaxID=4555 RepID=K4AP82_SETIT
MKMTELKHRGNKYQERKAITTILGERSAYYSVVLNQ